MTEKFLGMCAEQFGDREAALASWQQELEDLRREVNADIEAWNNPEPSVWRGRARELRDQRNAAADWHVYYIRIGDLIKIGVTGDIRQRMAVLMPDEILAVEPGGFALERERHRQFKHLRTWVSGSGQMMIC